MPEPQSHFASNQGIRIHYLDTGQGPDPALTPLVFVPGALGSAEDYQPEFAALAPRRCIAISLRGRGQSDAPPDGYGFLAHVRDIEAVIDASGVEDFCLMGTSLGVVYALGYAILHPMRLVGMILAEHPARYTQLPLEWVDQNRGRASTQVLQAIRRESADIELWDDLAKIEAPVLVLRGDQPDSLLSVEEAQEYIVSLPQAMALIFPGSGHRLHEPDMARYLGTIKAFLQGLDVSAQGDDI